MKFDLIIFRGISNASIITASIVVTVGSVPYLGLSIHNSIAMFKGVRIRGNIIDTALFGAIFVLGCDMIGRLVNFPYEVPINLVVGVIGSVIFIGLLFKRLNPNSPRKLKKLAAKGGYSYD